MNRIERAVTFDCAGEQLIGVLSLPLLAHEIGVVVLVGGPQYRVGSHRQFVLIARHLAENGFPVLRFDVRGMGDSSGDFRGFENIDADISCAMETLRREVPALKRIVLWGLCDAAAAALISREALADAAGLVLINPWVRNSDTLASAEVKHYYHKRFLSSAFWRKLFQGQVNIIDSLREFLGKLLRQLARETKRDVESTDVGDFREQMVQGLNRFGGLILVILSGRDLVSAEFIEFSGKHPALKDIWSRPGITRLDLADADHTFSNAKHRGDVESATRGWLEKMLAREHS